MKAVIARGAKRIGVVQTSKPQLPEAIRELERPELNPSQELKRIIKEGENGRSNRT